MNKWIKEFSTYIGILDSTITAIGSNEDYKSLLFKQLNKANLILDYLEKKENIIKKMDELYFHFVSPKGVENANLQDLRNTIEHHINKLKIQNDNNFAKADYHVQELNNLFSKINNNLNDISSLFNSEKK